jgi:hypothetical protein
MGAFAAMAQNSYGLKILGGVFIGFGLIFLFQFVRSLQKKDNQEFGILIELPALFLLCIIIAMRVFHIHFPYVEWIFALAGLVIILIYINKMIYSFSEFRTKNIFLASLVLIFYLCIILFIVALITVPFATALAKVVGAIALILMIGFIVAALLPKRSLIDGNNVSALFLVPYIFILYSFYQHRHSS